MITSTAHFDEVRHLLDQTLALMGLSGSMRNCEYLLRQLKGLSGRLAMRLAAGGDDLPAKRVGSELVALSLVRAHCLDAETESECWLPLSSGFLVPLDDVRDLVPTDAAENDDLLKSDTDADAAQEDSRRADIRRADRAIVRGISNGQRGRYQNAIEMFDQAIAACQSSKRNSFAVRRLLARALANKGAALGVRDKGEPWHPFKPGLVRILI